MRRGLLLVVLCTLALAQGAHAAERSSPLLGIFGNADRFERLTGQRSTVRHAIIGWDQGRTWGKPLSRLLERLRPVPMLGFGTSKAGRTSVRRSPRAGSPAERAMRSWSH